MYLQVILVYFKAVLSVRGQATYIHDTYDDSIQHPAYEVHPYTYTEYLFPGSFFYTHSVQQLIIYHHINKLTVRPALYNINT